MLKDLGFVAVDWLSFMANGGCGLRYGGFVGFFWIWVLLLRWWLWLAEVVVMEDDDDWPPPPPSSAPPSSCSCPIVRRGRTRVGNLGERDKF